MEFSLHVLGSAFIIIRECVFKKGYPQENFVGGGWSSEADFVVILIFELNKCEFSVSGFRTHALSLIWSFRKSVILIEANHKESNFLWWI